MTIIIEVGHFGSFVAMRTGYHEKSLLKSYQNLRGRGGIHQQRDLMSGDPCFVLATNKKNACANQSDKNPVEGPIQTT